MCGGWRSCGIGSGSRSRWERKESGSSGRTSRNTREERHKKEEYKGKIKETIDRSIQKASRWNENREWRDLSLFSVFRTASVFSDSFLFQRVGASASGLNGGFAIPGFALEGEALAAEVGDNVSQSMYKMSVEGLELLRKRIDENKIECDKREVGTLVVSMFPKSEEAYKEEVEHSNGRREREREIGWVRTEGRERESESEREI
jgi:hypothetical protein